MDTRTGQVTYLNPNDAEKAQRLWELWLAGVLDTMPQYAPVKDDRTTIRPNIRPKRKRKKKQVSYKQWCR